MGQLIYIRGHRSRGRSVRPHWRKASGRSLAKGTGGRAAAAVASSSIPRTATHAKARRGSARRPSSTGDGRFRNTSGIIKTGQRAAAKRGDLNAVQTLARRKRARRRATGGLGGSTRRKLRTRR